MPVIEHQRNQQDAALALEKKERIAASSLTQQRRFKTQRVKKLAIARACPDGLDRQASCIEESERARWGLRWAELLIAIAAPITQRFSLMDDPKGH